jgi:hypothetical protein
LGVGIIERFGVVKLIAMLWQTLLLCRIRGDTLETDVCII